MHILGLIFYFILTEGQESASLEGLKVRPTWALGSPGQGHLEVLPEKPKVTRPDPQRAPESPKTEVYPGCVQGVYGVYTQGVYIGRHIGRHTPYKGRHIGRHI